jgi:hypothetical protein
MSYRAREVDNKTAAEIQACLKAGLVTNKQNDLFDRISRNAQRTSHAARKARAADQLKSRTTDIRDQIEDEKASRKQSMQRQKALQDELSGAQPSISKPKTARTVKHANPPQASAKHANTSGRVMSTSMAKGKARDAANPYPIGK